MNSLKIITVALCLLSPVAVTQSLAQSAGPSTGESTDQPSTQSSAQPSDMVPANLETLGSTTVAETLAILQEDSARSFADHNGWLVGEKRIDGGSELWSFVPENHEAYPSAIQRLITDGEEGLKIDMNIQCDASTKACEDLTTLFTVMNENLIGVSESAPPVAEPSQPLGDAKQ